MGCLWIVQGRTRSVTRVVTRKLRLAVSITEGSSLLYNHCVKTGIVLRGKGWNGRVQYDWTYFSVWISVLVGLSTCCPYYTVGVKNRHLNNYEKGRSPIPEIGEGNPDPTRILT